MGVTCFLVRVKRGLPNPGCQHLNLKGENKCQKEILQDHRPNQAVSGMDQVEEKDVHREKELDQKQAERKEASEEEKKWTILNL